ncbi:Deoxycytidine monophosphate (dCMP) deaminase [Allomyces javanicus]|nr:Deoxycytidine monophosphate (dCMP) deaminase [Allomyces javanicus]
MLIVLVGPAYAGKRAVARILASDRGFQCAQVVPVPNGQHDPSARITRTNESIKSVSRNSEQDAIVQFATAAELEDHVMSHNRWREHWVVWGVATVHDLVKLQKRPFVLAVAVDAPVLTRFQRAQANGVSDLAQFLALDQDRGYMTGSASDPYPMMALADVTIMNNAGTLDALRATILDLQLDDPERLRPSWDTYFITLAHLAARRSNCMKKRVGCIVTYDNRVVSTGYNGTPRGLANCASGGCARCNGNARAGVALDACLCLHAEENALLEAGMRATSGATLYCTMFPCLGCAKKIVQAKVATVVYAAPYAPADDKRVAEMLFGAAGIVVRQHALVAAGGGGGGALASGRAGNVVYSARTSAADRLGADSSRPDSVLPFDDMDQ